jgi:hypothetical protein
MVYYMWEQLMSKEKAVRAIAWREPKNESGYVYRIQIDGLSTRTEKRILRVCGETQWRVAGSGWDPVNQQSILIFSREFSTEDEWLAWAKEFPYPLKEQNSKGAFKSIKLGLDSKNVRRGRPRKEKKSA